MIVTISLRKNFHINGGIEINITSRTKDFTKLYGYIKRVDELFNLVPHELLEEYENSLVLYYETDDIEREEDSLYSKSNRNFNSNIIKLSEDVITFEDFLERENIKLSNNVEVENEL